MILLIEDNEDDVFVFERAMRKIPNSPPFKTVIDGQQAVHYFQGVGKYADRALYPIPSLVFLDLKLPFLTGFEVLQRIKSMPAFAQIPVLILSSSVEDRDQTLAEELGANSFLVKPPAIEVLQQAISKFYPATS